MHNLKTLIFAGLLISLAVSPAYAIRHGWESPFDHDGRGSGYSEQFRQALKLTPQQETNLKEIRTANREERVFLQEKSEANREAIRAVFEAKVLDEPRLRELISEQAKLNAEIMIAKHATREKVDQILTPTQQKKKSKKNRRCKEPAAGKAENM